MNIKYGSGYVQGFYSNDVVHLGGLAIPTMEFGEATLAMDNEHGTLFSGMQGEGILGLAFQGISEHSMPTVVDLLHQNGQIEKRIFSFFLTRNVKRSGSKLILGGYDQSYAKEDFKYVPLIDDSFWAVGLSQLRLERPEGNDFLSLCSTAECAAIVDTGTSFIGVPARKLPQLLSFITHGKRCRAQKSKLVVCDCDRNMTGFPTIYLDLFAGHDDKGQRKTVRLTIEPADYLLQFFSDFRYKCAIGLQSVHSNLLGKDDDVYILGTTVLKTYYTVFDAESLRVGFAASADVKLPLTLSGPIYAVMYRFISLIVYMLVAVLFLRMVKGFFERKDPSSLSTSAPSSPSSQEPSPSYYAGLLGAAKATSSSSTSSSLSSSLSSSRRKPSASLSPRPGSIIATICDSGKRSVLPMRSTEVVSSSSSMNTSLSSSSSWRGGGAPPEHIVTNVEECNLLIEPEMRKGWERKEL